MDHKIALITGATRGIGKQIAITLAKEGYHIALNYRKENEELENTIKEIEENKVECLAVKGDVSSFEDCEEFVKQVIEKFSKIDVLVNNAGITKDMLLMRMKKEDFEQVIDVNLVGTFNVTKNVISHMLKARLGRIINISSVVGVSRKCWSNQLFGIQSRYYWLYEKLSQRSSFERNFGKCRSTWIY